MLAENTKPFLLLVISMLVKLVVSPAWGGDGNGNAMAGGVSPPPSPYYVKPSDIQIPNDVPMGQYLRVSRPFPNWMLICDENLLKKQRVCNVSQTIVDGAGSNVFSWSLAATEDGKPFFILRVPLAVGEGGDIALDLADGGSVVHVPVKGCNAQICIAYQSVGPRLREAVAKARVVSVSFSGVTAGGVSNVTLSAPLEGLASALEAI